MNEKLKTLFFRWNVINWVFLFVLLGLEIAMRFGARISPFGQATIQIGWLCLLVSFSAAWGGELVGKIVNKLK